MCSMASGEESSGARTFLPLEGATSAVWEYFGFPAMDGKFTEPDKKKRATVHCKLCGKALKYAGNTTNMRSHLEISHRSEFQAVLRAQKSKEDDAQARGRQRGHRSITQALQSVVPIPRSSPRWNQLTEAICYFVAKDMQPMDTVNDAGFRRMIHKFEPRYTPPDRKTLATHYLPQMFETEKKRVRDLMHSAERFAVTTDLWTSRAKHAYTGVTVHYITDEYSLESHLLETKEFPESHTAQNIAEELEGILQEWNLPLDKLCAATTDNGTNIVLAAEILGWQRIPCFSHTLQLAVERATCLPEVSRALAQCRRLVTHFNHSSKSTYLLKRKQEALHHPHHSLIQDVATRWNSAYYMVIRVLEQQQPLCATLLELKKGELMPSDVEFATMENYVQVMKPLVVITEAIGAEKWVTISTIRPLLYKLLNVHLKSVATDNRQQRALKSAMYADLEQRYTGELLLLLSKAAFLDPRLKALSFLSTVEKEELRVAIETEATAVAEGMCSETRNNSDTPEGTTTPPPVKRAKGEHKLLELLDDIVQPTEDQQLTFTHLQKARTEVTRYVDEPFTQDSPLEWWKRNAFRYPILSQMAKKYLAIPATSVPSERAFSSAGHIVNSKRSCLLPSSVNMLVFLAENLQ